MRRLLLVGVVTVMIYATLAVIQKAPAGTVAAAGATGANLRLTAPSGSGGCPLAPFFSFCNAMVGGTTPAKAFTLTNTSANAVTSVSVSLAGRPGAHLEFQRLGLHAK